MKALENVIKTPRAGTFFLLVCCLTFLNLRWDCIAHGFEPQVQQLDDTEILAVVDERPYQVLEAKELLAMRASTTETFVFFGLQDLIDAVRHDGAWDTVANEARKKGFHLSSDDEQYVESVVRDFKERILYDRHVSSKRVEPTLSTLKELYEKEKEERFSLPERLIIRQLFFDQEDEAQEAFERLEQGAFFTQLQEDYAPPEGASASRIVKLSSDSELEPSIVELLRGLQDGDYTGPLYSDDNWLIIQRQLHVPKSFIPIDSVIQTLADEYYFHQDQMNSKTFFQNLANDHDSITVYGPNLLNNGALALDDDLLLSVDNKDFTRGELRKAAGWKLADNSRLSERAFREMALTLGPVQDALLDGAIDKEISEGKEVVGFLRNAARSTLLANSLFTKEFDRVSSDITKEDVRQYAEIRKDIYEKIIMATVDRVVIPCSSFSELPNASIDTPGAFQSWLEEIENQVPEMTVEEDITLNREHLTKTIIGEINNGNRLIKQNSEEDCYFLFVKRIERGLLLTEKIQQEIEEILYQKAFNEYRTKRLTELSKDVSISLTIDVPYDP